MLYSLDLYARRRVSKSAPRMSVVVIVAGQDANKVAQRAQNYKAVKDLMGAAPDVESSRQPALGKP